jgi:hypothetical protein
MNLTKKTTKKNTDLARNVSGLAGMIPGRAIVIDDFSYDWDSLPVRDYYDIVVSIGSPSNLTDPDFTVLNADTIYDNYVSEIDSKFVSANTIYITSISLINELRKIKAMPSINNVNCIYTSGEPSTSPITSNLVSAGLAASDPGVHLALILGATTVYTTGSSTQAETVSFAQVQTFCSVKDPLVPYIPKNLISKRREPALNLYF